MKVAVSSTGKELDSNVSEVFGRCPYFIIAEIEGKKIQGFEAVENAVANQMGGAGISAAQTVAEKGVKAVITGNLGPRASDVLKQFNIEVYNGNGLVKEALQKFMENRLKKIQ
jgi:predicted Fe-Mo cluster-binding NifX family protein